MKKLARRKDDGLGSQTCFSGGVGGGWVGHSPQPCCESVGLNFFQPPALESYE